jgi:uncharacterized membrane protein
VTIATMILALVAQAAGETERAVEGISTFALLFMLFSMGAVTALAAWCFYRILKGGLRFESQESKPTDAARGDDPQAGRRT